MHESTLILTLTGSLAAALVLGYVTERLGLSPIVGYLLAGFIVGGIVFAAWGVRELREQRREAPLATELPLS